jgi:hypothetical protein
MHDEPRQAEPGEVELQLVLEELDEMQAERDAAWALLERLEFITDATPVIDAATLARLLRDDFRALKAKPEGK